MPRFVYVQQYGGFWKLTQAEWQEVCRSGAAGNGYTLNPDRQLLRRPSFIMRNENSRGYWIATNAHDFYQPLDWTPEDFADHLKDTDNA